MTYAHEYMHALQDQNFKFEEGLDYNDESCEADSERCAAIQALIEGEATLLELEWFTEYATRKEQAEVIDYYDNLESPIFDETPAFLRLDLIFPYDQGYTFAQTLFEAGGWEALDEAYANLPLSTEQILHPEKYPADRPLAVDLPGFSDVLGDEWELIDENVMGEWYTYLILGHGMDEDARLSERKAARAAEGWGGDRYVVFLNRESGEIIMALLTFWDHPDEANEFASAFQEYAEARYGQRGVDENEFVSWETEGEFVLFFAQGDHTIWISAPDRLVAQAVFKLIK